MRMGKILEVVNQEQGKGLVWNEEGKIEDSFCFPFSL